MAIEDQLQAIVTTLSRLEKSLSGVEAGQSELKAGQAKLEERLDRLEAVQTQLRVDLMDRMDRQQDTLTMVRDDILVNMASAESAHTANTNTRVEVRQLHEIVFAMERQIHNLEAAVRELQGKQ